MSIRIKPLIYLLFAFTLAACDSQSDNKVLLKDLYYVTQNGTKLIYKGDAVFSGVAWSNDGKALNIICQRGQMTSSNVYHPNDSLAIQINMKEGQYIANQTVKNSYTIYNVNGQPLLIFGRITGEISTGKIAWHNIDKSSASYNHSGIWDSQDLPYPYTEFNKLLNGAEAIIKNELHQQQTAQ